MEACKEHNRLFTITSLRLDLGWWGGSRTNCSILEETACYYCHYSSSHSGLIFYSPSFFGCDIGILMSQCWISAQTLAFTLTHIPRCPTQLLSNHLHSGSVCQIRASECQCFVLLSPTCCFTVFAPTGLSGLFTYSLAWVLASISPGLCLKSG